MNDNEKIILKAKKLYDENNFHEAIEIFLSIENLNSKQEKFKNLFLGHIYYKLNDFEKSFNYADLISQKNKSSEFASQLKYLSLFKLGKIDEALLEIINFLNEFPAKLYKITLQELLEDVKQNRIEEILANKILFLSNNNNVSLQKF